MSNVSGVLTPLIKTASAGGDEGFVLSHMKEIKRDHPRRKPENRACFIGALGAVILGREKKYRLRVCICKEKINHKETKRIKKGNKDHVLVVFFLFPRGTRPLPKCLNDYKKIIR